MSTAGRPTSFPAVLVGMEELEAAVCVVFEGRDAATLAAWEADAGQEWLETRLHLGTW